MPTTTHQNHTPDRRRSALDNAETARKETACNLFCGKWQELERGGKEGAPWDKGDIDKNLECVACLEDYLNSIRAALVTGNWRRSRRPDQTKYTRRVT